MNAAAGGEYPLDKDDDVFVDDEALEDTLVVTGTVGTDGLAEKELRKSSISTAAAEEDDVDAEVTGMGTTGGLYSSSFAVAESFLFFDDENENQEDLEPVSLPVAFEVVDAAEFNGTSAMMSNGLPIGIGGGTEGGKGGGTEGVMSTPLDSIEGSGGGGTGGGGVGGSGGAAPGGSGGGADLGGGGGASVSRVNDTVDVISGLYALRVCCRISFACVNGS